MPRIPPPLIALLAALLIWLLARYVPLAQFQSHYARYLAYGGYFIGICLDFWGFVWFRRARTTINPMQIERTSSLVTSGPYAFSRNPMYLGLLIILAGVVIANGALSGVIVPFLFAAIVTQYQIKPEEAVMREKFGTEFDNYAHRVRRWL
ncbi:MAG: isoprenylcysteine carboxylmethyltransferase family protein [Alphaproteobacteria bacterium]|nr:isoprenylcysteine carboxylmethyltransferase family protein [Alphaproteobacteria bacterium]MDE2339775.1 isoprenylcysteine carboxylmethyltransferase family protein [Alphaproteobacteria bacterium]